ncbi:hypothetical protein C8F01DRAFT_1087148 [Mycena amicta]|nr:hypothetical protein C8F01DRAFT_1087148 [Mycena amicta]
MFFFLLVLTDLEDGIAAGVGLLCIEDPTSETIRGLLVKPFNGRVESPEVLAEYVKQVYTHADSDFLGRTRKRKHPQTSAGMHPEPIGDAMRLFDLYHVSLVEDYKRDELNFGRESLNPSGGPGAIAMNESEGVRCQPQW